MTRPRLLLTLVGALAVAGCATTAIDGNYKSAQSFASERLGRDASITVGAALLLVNAWRPSASASAA